MSHAGCLKRQQAICYLVFMRISDDRCDTRQAGNLLRCALRIAAGHDDLAGRIVTPQAPYRGTRVLVGGGGYGAGIQHHDAGFFRSNGGFES